MSKMADLDIELRDAIYKAVEEVANEFELSHDLVFELVEEMSDEGMFTGR